MTIEGGQTITDLFDLSGTVSLVTGATGQLGRSISEALAEQGSNVVVTARTPSDCRDLADEISSEYQKALTAPGDVTDPDDVESIIDLIEESFGRLDIVVNNAYSGESIPFEEMSKDEFLASLDSALASTFLCTRESLPLLRLNGGSIINISSIYGVVAPNQQIYGSTGLNNPAQYGAAKAGVIQLTRWIATRYASEGIRANVISPGGLYNPDFSDREDYESVFVPNYKSRTPLGRMGKPEDLKGPVVFLASDASSWMTGQNIIIDGGWTTW